MKHSIGLSEELVNAMNHEPALRERWRRIVEAALAYEEEKLAEAAIVPAELTPKTSVFKQPNGLDDPGFGRKAQRRPSLCAR